MTNKNNLVELRGEIDVIDRELVALFERRMDVVSRIGEIKKADGVAVLDEARETRVLENAKSAVAAAENRPEVVTFMRKIMELSKIRQRTRASAAPESSAQSGIDKSQACYCGLCCENCAVKAKVEPAAKTLYSEMKKAGFENVIDHIPGGAGFWPFLKSMAEDGVCVSCREGRGGNPACEIRICAKEKNVEMCAFCDTFPCDKFDIMFKNHPNLEQDNFLLFSKGWDAWMKLQEKRRADGFTYQDAKAELS